MDWSDLVCGPGNLPLGRFLATLVVVSDPTHVAIVGAGDCGTRVALALRERGFAGSVTLIGNEATDPYERPTLSKTVLTNTSAPPKITTARKLDQANIVWKPDAIATRIDATSGAVQLNDGTSITASQLVIATGARARRPPFSQLTDAPIHTLRTLTEAIALRPLLSTGTKMVIIGGGFIGLEVAASASVMGCDVTVVEFATRLMSRVAPLRIAESIAHRHASEGVRILTGQAVTALTSRKGGTRVTLDDGTHLDAEVLVAGLGAVPNTELGATAGITIDNGIAVSNELHSGVGNIWAAGDCCSFPHRLYGNARVRLEAWRNALDQAGVVAANVMGEHRAYDAVPWFWSDQFDLQLQVAGLHEYAVSDVLRVLDDGTELWFGLGSQGQVVSASAVAASTSFGRSMKLAERLIANAVAVKPSDLADSSVDLRKLC
jgi:3-phenylpropionate/trans-cinnamate dioxygenase ferredoxin reductase component